MTVSPTTTTTSSFCHPQETATTTTTIKIVTKISRKNKIEKIKSLHSIPFPKSPTAKKSWAKKYKADLQLLLQTSSAMGSPLLLDSTTQLLNLKKSATAKSTAQTLLINVPSKIIPEEKIFQISQIHVLY